MAVNQPHPHSLSQTAYWTAAVRAQETRRTDRLVNDPWAEALAGPTDAEWLAARPPDSTLPIVLRTRFFDDVLLRITRENALRQIVLLAAGLDTRAFRLSLPSDTCVFELDQRVLLEYKAGVLSAKGAQPTCIRRTIPADLTEPWQVQLAEAGFDAHVPALFLLEGFLFYLPGAQVVQLLDRVCAGAVPASWLCFDIINGAMLTSPLTAKWVEMQAQSGAPWLGTLDDPVSFLETRGWHATLSQAGGPDANHGRWKLPVLPVDMPGAPHNWFVVAHKPQLTSYETINH